MAFALSTGDGEHGELVKKLGEAGISVSGHDSFMFMRFIICRQTSFAKTKLDLTLRTRRSAVRRDGKTSLMIIGGNESKRRCTSYYPGAEISVGGLPEWETDSKAD